MASYLDTIPTPKMTYAQQSASPGAAPSGTSLLWVSSVDGRLYRTGADGFDRCVDQGGVIRHPWSPDSASAWYAETGATPGAWTLDSGLSVAYPANGYAVLTWPADSATRKLVAALPGSAPFHSIIKMRISSTSGAFHWKFGFSAAGDDSDMDGIDVNVGSYYQARLGGANQAPGITGTWNYPNGIWTWIWVKEAGGTFDLYVSTDGVVYDHMYTAASSLSPTTLVVSIDAAAPGGYDLADGMWLDYIALGNSTPAGQ